MAGARVTPEIRISKAETSTNDRRRKVQNQQAKTRSRLLELVPLKWLAFSEFRIPYFGVQVRQTKKPRFHAVLRSK
jgi:hypothetical protein